MSAPEALPEPLLAFEAGSPALDEANRGRSEPLLLFVAGSVERSMQKLLG